MRAILVVACLLSSIDLASAQYLGNYTRNPYAGPPAPPQPQGTFNNPYGNSSNSPRLYNDWRQYRDNDWRQSRDNDWRQSRDNDWRQSRGNLNSNQYDPNSVANPYGRYGSPYSQDSINNPYKQGSPYRQDSPNNPYGRGLGVYR